MIPELRLDEEHRYWLGSRQMPGVTSILDAFGLIPSFAKDENKALRGSLIHKACHLLLLGKLDWSSVDSRILGKVLAYQKFLEENPVEPEELEQSHWHRDYLYAGTIDALVKHHKFSRFLYDIKTGSPAKWHALQTAGYAGFFPSFVKRATLFLYDDEHYNLHFHNDRSDWPNWISCLNVYRLKEAV